MEYNGVTHYDTNSTNELLLYDQSQAGFEEDSSGYQLGEDFVSGEEHYRDGEYSETQTIYADGGDNYGVSSVAFDLHEELLWMGNQGGHVTSYYGPQLTKYTSFQVHANQEVRYIITFDEGILALTQNTLRCQMRRGIPIYTYTSNSMKAMQSLMQVGPTNVIMGGHQPQLVRFDFNTSTEVQKVDVGENGCAILRSHSRYICAGDPVGNIKLLDPITLQIEQNLETHSGSLSDFDIHGNLLITCGFSQRQGQLSVDRFLMVYDLRMNRSLSPITTMLDPLLLRFLPSFSSRLSVVSAQGQMQLVDTVALSEDDLCLYQINTPTCPLSFDVSSSCQFMSIGDSGGQIHLFSSNAGNGRFNSFSRDTEFADPLPELPHMGFDDYSVPLSIIPMPYVPPGTKLASDWPEKYIKKVYRPTPPIDPEILRSMKMQGTIGYAPNPQTTKRNQVQYSDKRITAKSKLFSGNENGARNNNENENFVAIPKRYRKIDLKHSKDDSEFDIFNKTKFCGLEAHLPNNYCNPMLQVLFFLEPLRAICCGHLCPKEFCLSCELGFLFHMLDHATGAPCQASNFLRAFRTVPEASALGLILSDQNPEAKKKTNIIRLIQSWNRFIIHQLHYELLETRKRKVTEMERRRNASESPRGRIQFQMKEKDFPSIIGHLQQQCSEEWFRHVRGKSDDEGIDGEVEKEDDTEISHLFGMRQLQINRCLKCATDISKESTLLLGNLIYPHQVSELNKEHSFCSILQNSLCPEQTTPAWCDKCDKFRPTLQLKRLKSLPHVLTLNCGMDNQSDKDFWQAQMNILVSNITTTNKPGEPELSKVPSVAKPCRYGENCTRGNCRFRHPGQTVVTEKTSAAPASTTSTHATGTNMSQLYYTHSWLPTYIQIDLLSKGNVNIKKLTNADLEKPLETKKDDEIKQSVRYDLVGVVCHITENEEKKNLICFAKVGNAYHERLGLSSISQWYIFNDFSIAPVPEQEVTWFSLDWKVPCVLYWINRDIPAHFIPKTIPSPVTIDVFGEDKCIARDRGRKRITFTPLGVDEMPKKGELVAMDAEFVSLNQEEAELRSDGKLSTVKPSHRSVARITCIRGQGSLEGTPFIDDYISTQEQVFDYLTKFSGIQPGDLDANFSSKHLTTLKSTYQKLRFLIDTGVIFVGHGLKNDFRVINIYVPPEQVIDTVHLFHLPRQRMISLRFLAWHFLGIKIQSVTHDSIEDARTALQLYFHYLKLEQEGKVAESLEKLYQVGKSLGWQVPESWNINEDES